MTLPAAHYTRADTTHLQHTYARTVAQRPQYAPCMFLLLLVLQKQAHNWVECFCAHPGEKARRRDLRIHQYAAVMCSDMLHTGSCAAGDACGKTHSVFE